MVLALMAIDVLVAGYLRPSQHYDSNWRLPRTQSMSALPGYVDHIESLRRDARRPVVLFLGASPTWGEMNRDRHHTYAADFARIAHAAGVEARVYNLGADGTLVSDQYFIADSLDGHADLLSIQLTYHTFNPKARIDGAERFPELPRILGQPVSSQVADLLGIDPTPPFNLSGTVDRLLNRHWLLFREHDELAARLFGQPIRDELYDRWQDLTGSAPQQPPLAPSLRRNVGFDQLDPARQTEIVERYADLAHYRIRRDDSELRMLDLLCARLEHSYARAVFFMSPLNIGALEDFQVFDRRLYDANVAVIRAVVEKHGLAFIDWNQPRTELPSALFADATHTTDAGSAVFARRLYRALAPQLAAGART
jgi:lysophospholipase L1-like esterase